MMTIDSPFVAFFFLVAGARALFDIHVNTLQVHATMIIIVLASSFFHFSFPIFLSPETEKQISFESTSIRICTVYSGI